MRILPPKRLYRSIARFFRLLMRPTFQSLAERMTWRFCTLLIGEAIGIFAIFIWLLTAELKPWTSFLGILFFMLLMPLCTLQVISRLSPAWSESITFKYLALVAIIISWLSTMSGRTMVAELFHVSPSDFPNALAAASILACGEWISFIFTFVGIGLEALILLIGIAPIRIRGWSGLHSNVASLAVILVLQSLYVGTVGYGKALPEGVRKVIVARIAWDSDLSTAPTACLNEQQLSRPGQWKIFPRSTGESETIAVRSTSDLPEKPFWKFTPDELESFSNFDVEQVECGIKQAPIEQLRSVEAKQKTQEEYRQRTERYRGIAPVATIEIKNERLADDHKH